MKKILSALLFLLPLVCWAQTSSKPKDLNTIFDNAIRKDTTLKIVKSSVFPKSEFPSKALKTLTYSKDLKLWGNTLKTILDDTSFSEKDKVAFIKSALADTSHDAFEDINKCEINFWRTSKEATTLIEQYFASKAVDFSNDFYKKYHHLEFLAKSRYPQAYDSIVQYFNNRRSLTSRHLNEYVLLVALVRLGKEKEALHYLEMIINDHLSKTIETPYLGDRNYPYNDGTIIDLLCLSENQEISQKATDLLFRLLDTIDYDILIYYPLTEYLDRPRHLQLISKRFDHCSSIDFSKVDSNDLKDKRRFFKKVPNAYHLFSFMYNNASCLGEVKGREMWQKFVETMPYWKLYGQPFDMNQMHILENAFRDTSLTQQEMRTMLMQCKKTAPFFTEFDYHGNYKARFLRLLCKAYPDKKVSKEDYEKLQLSKMLKYTNPLQITSYDTNVPYRQKLTAALTDSFVMHVNAFAKNVKLNPIVLTKKQRFFISFQEARSAIFTFFGTNNRMVAFDAEEASVPTNYVELFETEYEPVLRKAGINNIEISQTTQKISKDYFHYKIYVKCGNVIYMHELSEEGTDWYYQQRLCKLLNLCLMQNKSALRLVEVDSGDQTVNVILCEPRKLKPLLNKYRITSWAVTHEDDFYNAGN